MIVDETMANSILLRPSLFGNEPAPPVVAVVIPCYRVTRHVLDVIAAIPAWVTQIICVDDCCPDHSGDFIERRCKDPRVRVVRNDTNLGVGGATIHGYREAMQSGADIVAKIDGDGQMDPAILEHFIQPISSGAADYAKGNRFYRPDALRRMPTMRLFGNAALSFFCKLSSGYWYLMDPTNGYTAVHCNVLRLLPLEKIHPRYFFESDLLFRLGTVRAVVIDVPMDSVYGNEVSNLSVRKQVLPFLRGHFVNFWKRVLYTYIVRDFNLASIMLLLGLPMMLLGAAFGLWAWLHSIRTGVPATAGTIMLAALPIIAGLQLLLSAVNYDISSVPRRPIHPRFPGTALHR